MLLIFCQFIPVIKIIDRIDPGPETVM